MSNIILPSGIEDTGGGYTTQRSVRLRSSASAYFSRTPASATNKKTWTFSAWVKRGTLSTTQNVFSAYVGGTVQYFWIHFYSDNSLFIYGGNNPGGGMIVNMQSTALYRDPSGWYHVVVKWDTTQATAANRCQVYVNGVEITSFQGGATYPSLNAESYVNSNCAHYIGQYGAGQYFDGYLTEINFVDGQALLPTAFGEYDSVRNTQWKPKAYTGTYGTNGFYLKFADNSAATAAALGKDSSGNGNNFTPTGISLTTGVTYDSMTDVPTLTSDTASNFCTLNPVSYGANNTRTSTSNGNLSFSDATAANTSVVGTTFPNAGKWYFELSCTSTGIYSVGVIDPATKQESFYRSNGAYSSSFGGAGTTGYSTWTNGDVIGVAWDADAGKIWYAKNNVWQAGSPSSGTTPTNTFTANTALTCEIFTDNSAGTKSGNLNFGAGSGFTYTPPTGFKALNTYNLPEPAVPSSDDYHKVYTYTGNGGGLQVGEIQKPLSLFNLDRSLRFRASASAYLSRTWGTPTNAQKFTCAFWLKRGLLGGAYQPFGGGTAAANAGGLQFLSSDALNFYWENGTNCNLTTTNVYRDPSLWYHIVVVQDTTQATPANRVQIYVNGVLQTLTGTYPSINATATFNSATVPFGLMAGRTTVYSLFTDGELADVYWIDGQAPDASNFGQYDGNYYWTPKAYTGTYGNNGFHLEFKDYSAATAAAIGKDTSGQGNNWTPSAGINLTTPANTNASWDSMVDVPTLTSADVANFCTLDPLRAWGATVVATLTEANQKLTSTSGAGARAFGTVGMTSGKWYWEAQWTAGASANMSSGVTKDPVTLVELIGYDANSWGYYVQASNLGAWNNGSRTVIGSAFTANSDVLGVAFDADIGSLYFYKNGTLIGSGAAFTGLTGATFYPAISANSSTSIINFGQRPFAQTPPTGFKALNSFNVREVTGDLESPDFVWIKSRSAGTEHALFNSVVGKGKYVRSSNAGAEVTDVNSLIQFNKNGFLLGNAAIVNASAATFVASAWKVAATTVTNTDGSITSQVRANPTAGISLITYTGIGSSPKTLGHGLGIAPKLVMVKDRNSAFNWRVWHASLAATQVLEGLNTTSLVSTQATFNNTVPTSTLISVGNNDSNLLGASYLMYAFAEIPGFSKFTSYAANASSTDGPFVACGFSPRWLMIKRATGASGTGGWIMYDTARSSYNVMSEYLFAEGAAGLGTLAAIDVTANGFKIRTNNVHINQTAGDIYIVMAFAEHPFKYALAR